MVEDEFITRTWNTEQIKMNLFLLIINSKKVKKKKKSGGGPEKETKLNHSRLESLAVNSICGGIIM